MVPCFPLLGLTPSGLFMGLSSTIIYTSELILCSYCTLLSYKNKFDLHGSEPEGESHFHMNHKTKKHILVHLNLNLSDNITKAKSAL